MSLLKTIAVDNFYTLDVAQQISAVVSNLPFIENEYGKEPQEFNMVGEDTSEMFSSVLNKEVIVQEEISGVFRIPELFIHFESFDSIKDWVFAVALKDTTFNIFEHKTGVKDALVKYDFNYKNLFEWDLTVNYQLSAGQGIFFRPWIFHSFHSGLIQTFRLKEV